MVRSRCCASSRPRAASRHQRPTLEVVRETQAHIPERAGVGQQLPRDGFAPIAAQIGDVTTQRIPVPTGNLVRGLYIEDLASAW